MTEAAGYMIAIGSLFLFSIVSIYIIVGLKDYETEILKDRAESLNKSSNLDTKSNYFNKISRIFNRFFKNLLRGRSRNRSIATIERLIPLYNKKLQLILGSDLRRSLIFIWATLEAILLLIAATFTILSLLYLPILKLEFLYFSLFLYFLLFIPYILFSSRKRKRNAEIEANWHYVVDALLLGVESGQPIISSLQSVTIEVSNQSIHLRNFLTKLVAELTLRDEGYLVFQDFMKRTDSRFVRDTFQILAASVARGTSVVTSLRSLRKNFMTRRRLVYQEAANKVATKMTLPLVVFFIPVQFVIIGLPLAIQFLEN
jgi:pilus assembly protein TadC